MKIPLVFGIFLLACTACGNGRPTSAGTATTPQETTLAGGYSIPRPLTASEEALFEKATASLQGVEYDPESVRTQVVAGTNYRFRCKAHTTQGALKTYEAEITIFVPLPTRGGEPEITRIIKVSGNP